MIQVKFKRVGNHNLPLPTKGSKDAAAWDIRSVENVKLKWGFFTHKMVSTGFSVEIPKGYEMSIVPRSGLSSKGVIISNSPGTIDSDYRGIVKILMLNTKYKTYKIKKGERIAQLKLRKVLEWEPIEVDELSITERGVGGFGSTGK